MKQKFNLIYLYLIDNKLTALVIFYFIIAIVLRALSVVDITIPCLWTKIFGIHCPGCGLTRAAICLIKLQPIGAFHANPLIYIVAPAIIYYIIIDFLRFKQKTISSQ